MAGVVLLGVFGVWLLSQATIGRLAARLLSYRDVRPGEVPPSAPASTDVGAGEGSGAGVAPGLGAAVGTVASGVPETGVLSIDNVARVALGVGLTRDQAVTAVAIAMRESRGNTAAHNPVPPDDSYGLWQINRLAHPQYSPAQLSTAFGNAKAMWELSAHGTRWSPWQIGGNPLARTNPTAAAAAVDRVRGSR
jgi:hypothetical protein